jgi:hypothetical protein
MTTKQTVSSNNREARKIIRELLNGLAGNGPDPERLKDMYIAHFTFKLLQLIHKGFMAKSKSGGSDDLGNSWKALAESTIRRKMKKRSTLEAVLRNHPSLKSLSPSQRKTQAAILARQSVPIGIDEGDLEKSYRPGKVSGYVYQPPPTQVVEKAQRGISISSEVEHAIHFHRKRRIYPSVKKMKPWLVEAARYARDKVVEQIKKEIK